MPVDSLGAEEHINHRGKDWVVTSPEGTVDRPLLSLYLVADISLKTSQAYSMILRALLRAKHRLRLWFGWHLGNISNDFYRLTPEKIQKTTQALGKTQKPGCAR